MNSSPSGEKTNPPPDEYELKIDDQVNKFLDLNHKLTFFLVTAAVGTLGFTLNFAVAGKLQIAPDSARLALVVCAAVLALLSAGLALLALNADISSFRLHLKCRYRRESFEDLTEEQQSKWDRINHRATSSRRWAFLLLVATVTFQVAFFITAFGVKGEATMHHYGEDSTRVVATETGFDLVFTNKVTSQVITMHIPREGTRSLRGGKELTLQDAQMLASKAVHLLRTELE